MVEHILRPWRSPWRWGSWSSPSGPRDRPGGGDPGTCGRLAVEMALEMGIPMESWSSPRRSSTWRSPRSFWRRLALNSPRRWLGWAWSSPWRSSRSPWRSLGLEHALEIVELALETAGPGARPGDCRDAWSSAWSSVGIPMGSRFLELGITIQNTGALG